MAVVTKVQRQRRDQQRYSVYLDGNYAFALSDLDLSTSGLRVGQELDEAAVAYWQALAGEAKAYDLALRYLSYRMRSRREISDYLARRGYGDETANQVIERLSGLGLVDDAAFARAWVSSRQSLRPRSRRQLVQELQQKGIAGELAAEAVDGIGEVAHEAMLDELIAKKRRQERYQDDTKLMAYLGRQGFGYDQIKKALARLDD